MLGDQLDRTLGALGEATPGETTVLLVESDALRHGREWHVQRLHLVVTAMRRFARELRDAGFVVDLRRASTLAEGVRAHRAEHDPVTVRVTGPSSKAALATARALDCEIVASDHFLCHYEAFAGWAHGRRRLRLEDFYRWQRVRLGYLMDGDEPAGGRWNHDADNRLPPPRDPIAWPRPPRSELDATDRAVLDELEASCGPRLRGAPPDGLWPTSRPAALALLDHFVEEALPGFGPYEDAMLAGEWRLRHSLLSSSLNLGLLRPREVCDRVESAYREGRVPIASAEGFIRQVIGWREYVWGLYWLYDDWSEVDELAATRPLPPAFTTGETSMRCLGIALRGVQERAYLHHIERLMVLGNLCLLAGVRPVELAGWMQARFVDGAEWVMLPNVVGMALYADGGRMATKPYAAGGRYVDRMSDSCKSCAYRPHERVGSRACPLTTLYWGFLDANRERLHTNHRLARQLHALDRLDDLPAVRERAEDVLELLDAGAL